MQRAALDVETLRTELAPLLALPDERPLPHYRITRPVRGEEEVVARYAVETEGHIRALLFKYLAQPAHAFSLDVEPTVHLYLPHVSADADLAEDPFVASLKVSPPLYALDVRGLGASMPEEERPGFFQPYGMDYMLHAYGLMLGRSYLGQRVYDVLCTIDLLAHEGAEKVHLYGRGQGALLALYAALFHERVASATLVNGPRSYHEWTQVPLVAWPAANVLPGVLQVCDLPDIVRSLGDVVRTIDPWGPGMGPIST